MISDGRIRIIPVDHGLLARVLGGHEMSEVTSDWPADATIIDVWVDRGMYPDRIMLKVHSATFDVVPEGGVLMGWTPTYAVIRPDDVLQSFIKHAGG